VRPRSFNPACLRELERQLFSLQGDESSNRFAQRLGISTAMWSRLKSGERQLGTRLAWRIVQVFPHLKVLVPDIPITPRVGLRVYSATFWDFVNENGPTPTHRPELGSCWEWTGTRLPYGYGLVAKRSKEAPDPYAHHFAWRSARGPIPSGLWVLHHCDNPPCVRPSHLWLGTAADNAQDRERKGRGSRSRRNADLMGGRDAA
jgi:hypothetical protein